MRRPSIRKTDIDAATASLLARGLKPTAIDFLPSGGIRFHFEVIAKQADDDLDRELAEFEAQHGTS
jgi:hypothetical protein